MLINKLDSKKLDWDKVDQLMPVIVQNAINGTVLMLGYMNQEALAKTLEIALKSDCGPRGKAQVISLSSLI